MFKTKVIAVAADTDVQVAGPDFADGVDTHASTNKIGLAFVPDSTPAVVSFAATEAESLAGTGFPAFVDSSTGVTENIHLSVGDELWVRATEAGDLYVRYDR